MTGRGVDDRDLLNSMGKNFLCLEGLWLQPSFLTNIYVGLFPCVKFPEA